MMLLTYFFLTSFCCSCRPSNTHIRRIHHHETRRLYCSCRCYYRSRVLPHVYRCSDGARRRSPRFSTCSSGACLEEEKVVNQMNQTKKVNPEVLNHDQVKELRYHKNKGGSTKGGKGGGSVAPTTAPTVSPTTAPTVSPTDSPTVSAAPTTALTLSSPTTAPTLSHCRPRLQPCLQCRPPRKAKAEKVERAGKVEKP
jgi:hypothetical protein